MNLTKSEGRPVSDFLLYIDSDIFTKQFAEDFHIKVAGLPSWLFFDTSTSTFSGFVPDGCEMSIKVVFEGWDKRGIQFKEDVVIHLLEPRCVPFTALIHLYLKTWIFKSSSMFTEALRRAFKK